MVRFALFSEDDVPQAVNHVFFASDQIAPGGLGIIIIE
jgi:hypothetical protein